MGSHQHSSADSCGDVHTKVFYADVEVAREYEELRFSTPGGQAWDRRHKDIILRALGGPEELRGRRVIDVACGTGRFTRWLRLLGAEVTGCDFSDPMLAQARAADPLSPYVRQDVLALGFKDKAFDIALCINALNHIASYGQAVAELCRVAHCVVVGVPNRSSVLVLHYVIRWLRGIPKGYGGFTFREYADRPLPYSTYFGVGQLRRALASGGMTHTHSVGGLMLPLVPSRGARLWERLDTALSGVAGRLGTFLVVVGRPGSQSPTHSRG